VLALLSVLLGPACVAAAQLPPPPPASGIHPEVAELVTLVDQHRRSVGCAPLRWHEELAAEAQRYSVDMATRDFYGHVDPDGLDLQRRLARAGIAWRLAGENVARTEHGAEQALYLWLQSDRHRHNLENCRFTHHGAGLSSGRWTHLFLAPPRGS
jgi:uncharacterized protein YkwD